MKSSRGSLQKNLTLSVCVLALVPVCYGASAQTSVSSTSLVGLTNDGYIDSLDRQDVSGNAAATASIMQSFTGLDGAGNTQTMTFTGNTVSQSDYGRLHVFTTGSLTNSYYNASNAAYADHDGNTINTAGSPTSLTSLGFAFFNDTLQYGGALQSGYKARYIFHIDGTNSGTGAAAGLGVNVDANPGDAFFDFDNGYLSTDWATSDFAVNGVTPQAISVQFSDQVVFNPIDLTDGQDYSGTSDFSATVVLSAIELIDANGNLASGWTVTSGSGTVYNTIQAVPEPGNLALLAGALTIGGLAFRRRKR